ARAMVVTSSIARCIEYFHAIREVLAARKSPYRAVVAFSGEHEYKGMKVTEASLNGFPSNAIAEQVKTDPYRILVVANKFQTGYDEPLLHTMYVDKALSGVLAVQTLSRLNRAHPAKHDTFVDRKSTRLNSSHVSISYVVLCFKKKNHILVTLLRSTWS